VSPPADEAYDELLRLVAAELTRLIRRLSSLSGPAWSGRRDAVLALLGQLAALDAALEGSPPHAVPELPDHGVADALAVIGGDLLEALVTHHDPAALDRALADLRAAWAATR
jgi:hypothetical protein